MTRTARHNDQALVEVALASASVKALGSDSASTDPIVEAMGSRGRRGPVRCRGREQQVPTHQQRDQVDAFLVQAHPGRDGAGDGFARHTVLAHAPFADVVQKGRDHQDVGAGDCADEAGGFDAGLHDATVDGEAVDDRGMRQQPHPLRQDPHQGTGLLQGLPHLEQSSARSQQPHEQPARFLWRRLGQRRALTHQASRGRRGEDDIALGRCRRCSQQESCTTGGVGAAIEHDLAG